MALEQRQTQIEVGAGQTEANLNKDFVEFLKKWSSPILLVIAAVVAGFWGIKQYHQAQDAKLASAFADLDAQLRLNTPPQGRQELPVGANPKILMQVAQDHAGKESVEYVARLTAADAWLLGAIRGLQPGAEFDTKSGAPTLKDPKDVLSDAEKKDFIDRAAEQYKLVAEKTAGTADLAPLHLRARFGQAAIDETRGQFDAAVEHYKAIEKIATDAFYPPLAKIAKDRAATIDKLKNVQPLPSEADIATIERAPVVVPQVPQVQGLPPGVTLEPVAGPPPGFGQPISPATAPNPLPTPAPTPTPAPAPTPTEPQSPAAPKP